MTIEQLIDKAAGPTSADEFSDKDIFDVLVVGGEPRRQQRGHLSLPVKA